MPSYTAPLRDITFVAQELLGLSRHYQQLTGCEAPDAATFAAIVEEGAKFAEQQLAPLNAVGDQHGCQWQDGKVTTPPGFADAYKRFADNGWLGLDKNPAFGGQGLPPSLGFVNYEMVCSVNHAWGMYGNLAGGAISTLSEHADEALQQRLLPPMIAGRWGGTMCLTEAHCGSDLGLLRTSAKPQTDGTYQVSGSKMFISAGEHDMTENIIHLVLARIEGAPAGVKGISLFAVPKIQVDAQGQLGAPNGVSCGSIEHKMGIHGNATCVLNFDSATGYLLGEANRGLNAMFTYINESRLAVSQQAQAHAEASFQGALAYARDRVQMRATPRLRSDQPADPIIGHADVRRMLLTQKAYAEGGRMLAYTCAKGVDQLHHGASAGVGGGGGGGGAGARRPGAAHADCQRLPHRNRQRGRATGYSGIRWPRLHPRVGHGADCTRRAHHRDLRRHQHHPGPRPADPQGARRWWRSPGRTAR